MYLCGEMLDAFGPIGGYNFLWGWATGRAAGLGASATIKGLIKFEKSIKKYGKAFRHDFGQRRLHAVGSKVLFEDVTTTFSSGRRYGLTGPNGAGKSTFMKLLTGESGSAEGKRRPAEEVRRAPAGPGRLRCPPG